MAVSTGRRKIDTKNKRSKKAYGWVDDESTYGWGNEVAAILFFAFASYLGLAVISSLFGATDFLSGMGAIGTFLATSLTSLFGAAGLVPALWLCWIGAALWQLDEKPDGLSVRYVLIPLFGVSVVLVSVGSGLSFFNPKLGGEIGLSIGEPLKRILGSLGVSILLISACIAGLSLALRRSIGALATGAYECGYQGTLHLIEGGVAAASGAQLLFRGLKYGWDQAFSGPQDRSELPLPKPRLPKAEKAPIEKISSSRAKQPPSDSFFDDSDDIADEELQANSLVNHYGGFDLGFDIGQEKEVTIASKKKRSAAKTLFDEIETEGSVAEPILEAESVEAEEVFSHVVVSRRSSSAAEQQAADKAQSLAKETSRPRKKQVIEEAPDFSGYVGPSYSLLTPADPPLQSEDDDELIQKSRQIELKLRDFNIHGRVTEVHPGPVITLFEFEPAPGVKVGKIAALQDDLAMSLRASSIRIIAPIPRKGTVGIEVPNKHRDIVRLRDVLETPEAKNSESILSVPLGKDTYGDPVVVDIATMPHLLMAGATGTGKSVSINALLVSLLYKASPADLGLILIDPKILELSVYEGIPHLRVPVVTVPRQAKAVLDWAVKEMDRRYRVMQKHGVRSIDGYNAIIKGESAERAAAKEKLLDPSIIDLAEAEIVEHGTILPDEEISPSLAESSDGEPVRVVEELKPLPKIVIVIDELADLMLTVGRDIEELITRLAQKARAAGIHLILATQRPSVDVITGLIKANFPARVSFRVTTRIDSRTILDSMGAERLLGKGDMLFMQPGAQHLKRIHGAFVSDAEVVRVVEAVKKQAAPFYDQKIIDLCERALKEEAESNGQDQGGISDEEFDPLYDKAVELVVQKGQASTSMVQLVFRIGYNRAARIIELMEKEGVIGPMDGVKPREVLAQEIRPSKSASGAMTADQDNEF
jgi:S-DNA-T family DNA segregation ATPase FtsK/SpoIIIE